MKCNLVFSDGQKLSGDFCGDGRNFTVEYLLDGDRCILSYSDGVLYQKRTGAVTIGMEFRHGEESVCTIGEGELCGTLPLVCEKLSVERNDGVKISLVYLLGGERMSLDIKINF